MQKNNDIPIGARLSNLDKIFKESVRSYCNWYVWCRYLGEAVFRNEDTEWAKQNMQHLVCRISAVVLHKFDGTAQNHPDF